MDLAYISLALLRTNGPIEHRSNLSATSYLLCSDLGLDVDVQITQAGPICPAVEYATDKNIELGLIEREERAGRSVFTLTEFGDRFVDSNGETIKTPLEYGRQLAPFLRNEVGWTRHAIHACASVFYLLRDVDDVGESPDPRDLVAAGEKRGWVLGLELVERSLDYLERSKLSRQEKTRTLDTYAGLERGVNLVEGLGARSDAA